MQQMIQTISSLPYEPRMDKYEILTCAITARRRKGKTTTLWCFGEYYAMRARELGYPQPIAGNQPFANIPYYQTMTDIKVLLQMAGILLVDEGQAQIDNRVASSIHNRVVSYEAFMQGKLGAGKVKNSLFMCLPAHLREIDLVDIRFRTLFDFEIEPLYDKWSDILWLNITERETGIHEWHYILYPRARGFMRQFDSYRQIRASGIPLKHQAYTLPSESRLDSYTGGRENA